jgi:Ca2+/H+ antiporter
MEKVIHELTWLIFLALLAAFLLPMYVIYMDFRTTEMQINRIEKLFLAQILSLSYLAILIMLYIVRFVINLIIKKFFSTAEGKKP